MEKPIDHNAAGWALLSAPSPTPAQLDDAMAHFRTALELAPDDPVPLANLCDALVAAGREADAIAEAERATEITSNWNLMAGAHNWLGWRLAQREDTLEPAITHLRAALKWRPRWGLAHVNLGKVLEVAHHGEEAYAVLAAALHTCEDTFDRAFCHERIGAYQARHGWLRNALVSMRAALREDAGARHATYREGITWIEQQLRAAGIEPPPSTNAAWDRACELEIPPGFLATNELGQPLADAVIEVERLVRAERWADAATQLEQLRATDYNLLFDAVGYAEAGAALARRAGAHDAALTMMRLVVEAYEYYASGASSGGEGMARMADVHRTRLIRDEWAGILDPR